MIGMIRHFRWHGGSTRLAVSVAMLGLLLMALGYWWLENLAHEIFGTAMFLLLGRHLYSNRRQLTKLFAVGGDRRRQICAALHVLLAINVVVLLITSVVISKSVFSFLPFPDSVRVREVHWFCAYWVMIFIGAHIGLHWSRVTGIVSSTLTLPKTNLAMKVGIRIVVLLFVTFGLWSFSVLSVWTKLTFNYSLDFWDFNNSVAPFFGHWIGVTSLPAIVAHYASFRTRQRGSRSDPSKTSSC